MSLKKYFLLVLCGVFLGSSLAYVFHVFNQDQRATRNIASTKMARLSPTAHVGKTGAPLLVQVTALPESDARRGVYRLLAHITFNQPMNNLRFQWALPVESRVIEGATEGNITLSAGEDFAEQTIEIQITDQNRDSQILFDINYQQDGIPMGVSDLFVVPSQL